MLRFSRPMALSAASRANFTIGSGAFPSIELITPRVDPVERAVIFGVRTPLEKNTQYALDIHSGTGFNGLVAYDGAQFQGTQVIRFTTADDDDVSSPDSDIAVQPCEVYDIFQSNCMGSPCHGPLGGEGTDPKPSPAMGLNLLFPGKSDDPSKSFVDPIQETAVGKPAMQVQDPSAPSGPPVSQPRKFPRGMALVDPNHSASSYLMYKILMLPPKSGNPAAAYIDPTVPDLADPGKATADDLSTRMFGEGMPDPSRAYDDIGHVHAPLEWTDRKKIRAWIDEGAPPCACKTPVADTHICPPPDAGVDGGSDSSTDGQVDSAVESGADADASDSGLSDVSDASGGG